MLRILFAICGWAVVWVALGFNAVEVRAVFCKWGAYTKYPGSVPSDLGYKSEYGSGTYNPSSCDADEALVRANRSSKEDSVPPWLIQFGSQALWHEPLVFLSKLAEFGRGLFAMQPCICCKVVGANEAALENIGRVLDDPP